MSAQPTVALATGNTAPVEMTDGSGAPDEQSEKDAYCTPLVPAGRPITERQRATLTFITDRITVDGFPPTLRDIGKSFGIRSTNGVNDHLRALERKGYIVRRDMISRGIRVVSPTTGKPSELPDPVGFLKAENRALRHLLARVIVSSTRGQYLTAEMVVVLGDVRAVLHASGRS